jgi:hypothetical protein
MKKYETIIKQNHNNYTHDLTQFTKINEVFKNMSTDSKSPTKSQRSKYEELLVRKTNTISYSTS